MTSSADLGSYRNPPDLDKGRGPATRALWFLVNALVLQNRANPSSAIRVLALKLFGARIGPGALVRPGVNVKSPWHLTMGANCWLGENVWIDSLAPITLGNNVCISQGAYLCCGNHDWTDPAFGKKVLPITVEDGVWIATHAIILPGVVLRSHSVVAAGAVVTKDTEPYTVYAGNPAVAVKRRSLRER